jgi:hypothetical protein
LSGSTHERVPSFILQLGIYPILFLDIRSIFLECFALLLMLGGGPNYWVSVIQEGASPIRGLFIWRIISSQIQPETSPGCDLGPIYTLASFSEYLEALAAGPNC